MHGMSNPISKIARADYDIRTASKQDLSFTSENETPKIFATKLFSSNGSYTLPVNYPCAFYPFRKLNSTDYTHDITLDNDISGDAYRGSYISYDYSTNEYKLESNLKDSDVGSSCILYFDQLDEITPSDITIADQPKVIISKENHGIDEHPIYQQIDSRFNTFKVAKTGTLTLTMPSGTLGSDTTYSSDVVHGLEYPCFYLPEIGYNWSLQIPGLYNSSFVVNDYIGSAMINFRTGDYQWGSGAPYLSVWVDSSKLYMTCFRPAATYNGVTITLYYTLFYNDLSEDYDLLT